MIKTISSHFWSRVCCLMFSYSCVTSCVTLLILLARCACADRNSDRADRTSFVYANLRFKISAFCCYSLKHWRISSIIWSDCIKGNDKWMTFAPGWWLCILGWRSLFVCLGCGLISAPLLIPPEFLSPIETPWVLDGALTLIYKLGLSCAKLYHSLN